MNLEILKSYEKTCLEYIGNSNSLHELGTKSKKLEDAATNQILKVLNLKDNEIIYTSGNKESNNLVVFGLLEKYQSKNKEIIVDENASSSVLLSLKQLEKKGFVVHYIKQDIKEIKNKLNDNTVLICLCNFNQIKQIKTEIADYSNIYLFVNVVNAFFYSPFLNLADFITIDASNVNGIFGIGMVIKNKNIVLETLLHGGKSTTIYRSGTPALPLIASFSKAIRLTHENEIFVNNNKG